MLQSSAKSDSTLLSSIAAAPPNGDGKPREPPMSDIPESGESLSAKRRQAIRNRWNKPAASLPMPPAQPAQLKLVVDNKTTKAKPKPPTAIIDRRVCEITDECIAAYNAILAKPHGKLAKVSAVGIENRRKDVKRSIEVASRMCLELYGDRKITPEFWQQYFSEVNKDDFKAGRQAGGPGHENWLPTFEYLTRPAIMVDVFEKAMSRAG
jgi:hypothetical protein